jgi:pilus assembly protein Flp/PilA
VHGLPPTDIRARSADSAAHFQGDVMLKSFLRDDSGLELSEYAIAAALVMLAVVLAFANVSANITTVINNLASYIK